VSGRNAVPNDEGEEISADDTEHASNGGADQPFQAHHAQSPLEDDYDDADQQANGGVEVPGQVKRIDEEADNSDDENKQKTNKYDVHK